ncbi:single-stranded DNA-binding protein [Segatella baroniae]|jgi:single-strand binding protein|uniref:Single-stranded DNA-binding protein n=1 Tax=Segatella baroniae F0067 TaxID=1115809 RepID=U2QE64_9BACT|nr:single-stranded DNA-binding protein [Segatella baroniae]ERK39608.1 single-stranded DNA-binding protein [Segatella baroniae F0067]
MNKVMLIGNVGKEPDVRYYDNDQAVAQFPLATTERGYTLQNGTQVPDHTDWHNIIMWRGLAKVAEKYVHKGDRIYVEGRLRYRSYDDQKGQRRYVTEILADNMELLSTRHDTDAEKKTAAQSDERKETANDTKSPLPF